MVETGGNNDRTLAMVASDMSMPQLATELDLPAEKQMVAAFVSRLNSICAKPGTFDCQACSPEISCACKTQTLDLLAEILRYMFDHFAQEDILIDRSLPPALVQSHKEAHAEITKRLGDAMQQCWNTTACTCHGDEVQALLEKHIEDHDTVLQQALSQR